MYRSERHYGLAAEFSDTGPAVQCCSGDCNQGRSCPVRQACEQPESRLDSDARSMLRCLYAGIVAVLVAAVGLHFLIRWMEM